MHKSFSLLLGCALVGILSSEASYAGDEMIRAQFRFSNPNASEMGFRRDLDVCLRKSTSPWFHIRAPGPENFHSPTPLGTMGLSKPDPRRFLSCMQEKSYRVDPRGPYQTGWITFLPKKRDVSL